MSNTHYNKLVTSIDRKEEATLKTKQHNISSQYAEKEDEVADHKVIHKDIKIPCGKATDKLSNLPSTQRMNGENNNEQLNGGS